MTLTAPSRTNSAKLLMVMGGLWLVLALTLLVYQLSAPAQIEVQWETATEINTAGFYLYRSTSPDGTFDLVNNDMVPSQGNTLTGGQYAYIDSTVQPGKTYYYVLEEVENDLTRHRYDDEVFSYMVPRVTWWAVVLTAVSILVGPILIVTGFKESKTL